MANIIAVIIIIALVLVACYYLYKEKRKGRHCIGCPSSGSANCNCSDKK